MEIAGWEIHYEYTRSISVLLLAACGKEAKQKDETPTVEGKNNEIQDNKNNEKINVSLDTDIEITSKGSYEVKQIKDFLKVASKEYENLTGEFMQVSGTKKFLYYEKKFKITK